jgi:Zn-dependent M28 family amino/carboxypeptidase
LRHHRILTSLAALGLATAGLALVGQPAEAAPDRRCARTNDTVAKLMECVTLDGVMEHQQALQDIADDNGGVRASGTPGYDASVDYVEGRLQQAGYVTSRQEFTFHAFAVEGPSVLEQTAPTPTTYVEGTDYAPTSQSEPGEVTAAVVPVDVNLTLPRANTSGCQPEDFAGFPAGSIALLQRGDCTFAQKGNNASAAGAAGIIFFNQGNNPADPSRMGIPAVTLGDGYTGTIPAVNATYALGEEWVNTPGLMMHMNVNVSRVLTTTENLVADLPGGDPHNVVMAGAHLDSVPEGPGINDNGSGTSALIEVAEQMAKLRDKLPNKVRFAWWGAEEANLVGSTAYVASLTVPQRSDIELYLNFDMIGSPNYGLFILDGDGSSFGLVGPAGSDDIEAHFEDFYEGRGEPYEPKAFDGRSDYNPFILNGIPAGGLFTGAEVIKTAAQVAKWGGTAGIAFDPCYHQACDTIDNLSLEALDLNSDAVAHAMLSYAAGYEVINQP